MWNAHTNRNRSSVFVELLPLIALLIVAVITSSANAASDPLARIIVDTVDIGVHHVEQQLMTSTKMDIWILSAKELTGTFACFLAAVPHLHGHCCIYRL